MAELLLTIPDAWWWSTNERVHHHVRATKTKAVRQYAAIQAQNAGIPRFMQAHVCVFVGYPTRRRADPTNIAGTVSKAAIDGLTDAGVWEDDDSEHVIAVEFRRDTALAPKGHHTLRLVLTDQCLPF